MLYYYVFLTLSCREPATKPWLQFITKTGRTICLSPSPIDMTELTSLAISVCSTDFVISEIKAPSKNLQFLWCYKSFCQRHSTVNILAWKLQIVCSGQLLSHCWTLIEMGFQADWGMRCCWRCEIWFWHLVSTLANCSCSETESSLLELDQRIQDQSVGDDNRQESESPDISSLTFSSDSIVSISALIDLHISISCS